MEAATAASLYGAETAVEGAAVIAKGLSLSTGPLSATFTKLKAPSIPRSSHTVTVVKNKAYIFGGEISPRQPVDNAMHVITLPSTSLTDADYVSIPPRPARSGDEVPIARVGVSFVFSSFSVLTPCSITIRDNPMSAMFPQLTLHLSTLPLP